jgi:DNA-binding MarR family transcriptional regulator
MGEETRAHDGLPGQDAGTPGREPGQRDADGRRRELLAEFLEATRRAGSLMQLMSQEASDRIGINATDLNCLNILSFSGAMTAGQLAQATGLTTASITTVIDRLEQAGYARRERDTHDRRKVTVRLEADAAFRGVAPVFGPMIAAWQDIAAEYSDDELELIAGFQRRTEAAIRAQLAQMRRPASPR